MSTISVDLDIDDVLDSMSEQEKIDLAERILNEEKKPVENSVLETLRKSRERHFAIGAKVLDMALLDLGKNATTAEILLEIQTVAKKEWLSLIEDTEQEIDDKRNMLS
jgi:hypothetical protein